MGWLCPYFHKGVGRSCPYFEKFRAAGTVFEGLRRPYTLTFWWATEAVLKLRLGNGDRIVALRQHFQNIEDC